MEELVYLKEAQNRGLGIFAKRNIKKDEVILEFNGPRIKIEDMEGIPREVWDHLSIVNADGWSMECQCGSPLCRGIIGEYRTLPNSIKKKYEKYTPDWIKNT